VSVESIDLHPTKKWVVVGTEDGRMTVWDYSADAPIAVHQFTKGRTEVRFIARKSWVAVGSRDGIVHIVDENGKRLFHRFEAHKAKVRCMVVHPTKSLLITGAASPENSIKTWDLENDFRNERKFIGKPLISCARWVG